MKRFKILALYSGCSKDEVDRMRAAFTYLADKEDVKGIGDYIDFEDVIAFKESKVLSHHLDEFGYAIIFDKESSEKTFEQVKDLCIRYASSPKYWDDSEDKKLAAENISYLFKDWKNQVFERRILESATKLENEVDNSTDCNWINANIEDVERLLRIELDHNRPRAIIFAMPQDKGPEISLADASKTLRAPINELTPVLVGEEVLQEDKQREKVEKTARDNGFKKPYLLTIKEFMVMLRLMCQISTNGKAIIEVNNGQPTQESASRTPN